MVEQPCDVVEATYRLLLNREPDPAGFRHWSTALEGGMPRTEFIRAVIASAEFRHVMSAADVMTKYNDVDLVIPIQGRQFRVPATDTSLVPHLLEHRSWEPHIMAWLRRNLKPSHVFVDVGANLGYFVVLCAPLVSRVVAFEPAPDTYAYCRSNVSLNGLTNVELHQMGLWHENATVAIKRDPSSLMTATLAPEGTTMPSDEIRVASLDRLRRGELDLPRIDVLKMDIEGAELAALTGMRDTIARLRPTIIMEANRPMLSTFGVTIDDIWHFFQEHSYELRVFEHWQEREPIPAATLDDLCRLCPGDSVTDLLALPRAVRHAKTTGR